VLWRRRPSGSSGGHPCRCGAHGCRGRFRADDWRRPKLWARYAGYFMPYLARRIAALERPD